MKEYVFQIISQFEKYFSQSLLLITKELSYWGVFLYSV